MLKKSGLLFIFISSIFFGLMALSVAVIHKEQSSISSNTTGFVRAIVSLMILFIYHHNKPSVLLGDKRPALWLRGLFGGLALLCYFYAIMHVGMGEAAFLNQTSSVWLIILAPFFLNERPKMLISIAVIGSLFGLFLLSWPRNISHSQIILNSTYGRILGALSGLLAASAYISVKYAGKTNSSSSIVFYFSIVSTILSGVALLFNPIVYPENIYIWLSLFCVGFFATLGQLFMTKAYQIGNSTTIAAGSYANPLLTAILGVLFLNEKPDNLAIIGMFLILICGIVIPFMQVRSSNSI